MTLLYLLVGGVALALLWSFLAQRISPQRNLTSEDEITRAARSGNWVLAIRSYRALHGVGYRRARERVTQLVADGDLAAKNQKPS